MFSNPYHDPSEPLSEILPERRAVTIMYIDIIGSSEIVSTLSPDDAADFLDPAVRQMIDAIHAFDGKVLRVLGDGIKAVFGAIGNQENHALRAVLAGMKLLNNLKNAPTKPRIPRPEIRIGVHSGYVIVRWQNNDFGGGLDTVGSTAHVAAKIEEAGAPNVITLSGVTAGLIDKHLKAEPVDITIMREEIFQILPDMEMEYLPLNAWDRSPKRLIGRKLELADLAKALPDGAQGTSIHTGIIGEAGMGKSHLIRELVNIAIRKNIRIEMIGGLSVFRHSPFYTARLLVRNLMRFDQTTNYTIIKQAIDQFSPDPAIRQALKFLTNSGPSELDQIRADKKFELIQAAIELLFRQILKSDKLLLIVEDVHYMDAESLRCVQFVTQTIHNSKLTIVASSRPNGEAHTRKFARKIIQLEPLDASFSKSLVENIMGNPDNSKQVSEILLRSEGLPLALIEFAKKSLNTIPSERDEILPLALEPLLREKIDQLSQPAHHLVQIASAMGSEVDFNRLWMLFSQNFTPSKDAVTEAVSQGILTWKDHKTLRFEHHLHQEVCYSGLTRHQRREIHQWIYDVLGPRTPAEIMAYHAEHAGALEVSLEHLWAACDDSIKNAALETMQSLYFRAASICDDLATDEAGFRKVKFGSKTYVAFQQLAQEQTLVPLFEDAISKGLLDENPFLKAMVLCHLSSAKWFNGVSGSKELAEEAAEIAQKFKYFRLNHHAQFLMSNSDFQMGNVRQAAMRLCDISEAIYKFSSDEDHLKNIFLPACQYRVFASWYLVELGEYAKAEELYGEARSIAQKMDHTHSHINCDLALGYRLYRKGRNWDAADTFSSSYDQCIENSNLGISSLVAAWSSLAHAETGELEKARKILTTEISYGHYEHRNNCWKIYFKLALAKLAERDGNIEEAMSEASMALQTALDISDPVHEVYSRMALADLLSKSNLTRHEERKNHLNIAKNKAELAELKPALIKIENMLSKTV